MRRLLFIVVVATVTTALVREGRRAGDIAVNARGDASATKSVAAADPEMSREEALARVRQLTARFPRIDRTAAKLMTWAEFQEGQASGDKLAARDPESLVWVVAVSGEFRPGRAPARVEPPVFPWGIAVFDAQTRAPVAAFGSGPDAWPPYFDSLPDRGPVPPP